MVNRAINCLKSVIRNCYHKGVLEEASTTLSAIVAYCTNARQNITFLELTVSNLLSDIPCVPASNSTVRRCAEKRLILCSMVLSDKRPTKVIHPFLYILQVLIYLLVCLAIVPQSNVAITRLFKHPATTPHHRGTLLGLTLPPTFTNRHSSWNSRIRILRTSCLVYFEQFPGSIMEYTVRTYMKYQRHLR